MAKEKNYAEERRTIGALLRTPYRHLADEVYDGLNESGYEEVRQSHSAVFRHILPQGSRITELAELAGMTKQSMASLVAHLQRYDYLRTEPDPDDGRAKRVVLTERGEAVQRRAERLSRAVEQRWAEALGKEEMATLRRLLEQLYGKLEEGEDEP